MTLRADLVVYAPFQTKRHIFSMTKEKEQLVPQLELVTSKFELEINLQLEITIPYCLFDHQNYQRQQKR